MRRRWTIGALVMVIVAVVGVWWSQRTDEARVEVGWVFVGGDVEEPAFTEVIRLPWIEGTVSVGKPQQGVGAGDDSLVAPKGGSVVTVALDAGSPLWQGIWSPPGPAPRIELLADGRSHVLSAESDDAADVIAAGTAFRRTVAVAGADPELAVRFTLGDESMTVTAEGVQAGRFAELADLPLRRDPVTEEVDCGRAVLPRGVVPVKEYPAWLSASCSAAVDLRTPYLASLGWAAPGHQWTVVVPWVEMPYTVRVDGIVQVHVESSADAYSVRAETPDGRKLRVLPLSGGEPSLDAPAFAVEAPPGQQAEVTAQVSTVASRIEQGNRDGGGLRCRWRFLVTG